VESFMGYMEKSIYGLITNYSLLCRVWRFHSGGYEEYHLVGYDAV
jgi:hypothetical protein